MPLPSTIGPIVIDGAAGASEFHLQGSPEGGDDLILKTFGNTTLYLPPVVAAIVGANYTAVGDAAYPMVNTDRTVVLTATLTANRTWTLPSANNFLPGTGVTIIDAVGGIPTAFNLIIARNGADTINGGAASVVLEASRSSIVFISDGNSNWLIVTRNPSMKVLFFTSGSSYTPSIGVRAIFVECVGGGGAGGGAALSSGQSSAGAGGGSGAYSAIYIVAPKTSYAYAIGGGGTGVSGATGNNGGDTTFDSTTCVAKGGSGGTVAGPATSLARAAGAAGGLASSGVGDVTAEGGQGGAAILLSATQGWSGQGGGSYFGSGGGATITVGGGSTGGSGKPYGSGGGGGATTTTAVVGANGAAGVIRVTEYF